MKKDKFTFIPAILTFAILFNACSDSTAPTISNESDPLKGAYILYGAPAFTDYAFYDAVKDSVTDFVYRTTNPGRSMIGSPGEMSLNSDRMLYITALSSIANAPGTIYKIDPDNTSMVDSLQFGINPTGFAINNNRIVVSNSGSSTVSILDLDLNLLTDTIQVGPAPDKVLYGYNRYIITRMPYDAENSAALINETNNEVTKLFYPGFPVSSIYNVNGIFVSTLNSKSVYMIETESFTTIDSFAVPTMFSFINELEFKTQNSFFAVAGGREVWLATVTSGSFTFTNIYTANSGVNIQTIAYESNTNELYLGVWHNNGFLVIIDGTSGVIKRSKSLAPGLVAYRIVFRY